MLTEKQGFFLTNVSRLTIIAAFGSFIYFCDVDKQVPSGDSLLLTAYWWRRFILVVVMLCLISITDSIIVDLSPVLRAKKLLKDFITHLQVWDKIAGDKGCHVTNVDPIEEWMKRDAFWQAIEDNKLSLAFPLAKAHQKLSQIVKLGNKVVQEIKVQEKKWRALKLKEWIDLNEQTARAMKRLHSYLNLLEAHEEYEQQSRDILALKCRDLFNFL